MNELVDLGFLVAKVAAIGNEKAKMAVDGVSLAYNVMQINRFRHMISELYQIGNYVAFNANIRGYCTLQEYNLVQECQRQINDCQNQISKHGVMSVIDGFSLLLDMISASNRRYNSVEKLNGNIAKSSEMLSKCCPSCKKNKPLRCLRGCLV